MKKLLYTLCLMAGLSGAAHADGRPTFEVGYSSFSQYGVICTTGTAMQVNASDPGDRSGMRIAGYRVQNQDSADAVWLGDVDVSTHTTNGNATAVTNLGEKLSAGADGPYPFWRDRDGRSKVALYCLAADAAGADGVALSVFHFYY